MLMWWEHVAAVAEVGHALQRKAGSPYGSPPSSLPSCLSFSQWIVRQTWVAACTAGVGVVDVPAMGVAVIPVVKPLEGREGLQMAFHCCQLLIRREWIASASTTGSVMT